MISLLCTRRAGLGAGARAGGKRARPQPAPGAAQLCLHALPAQRVRPGARTSGGPVYQPGLEDTLRFEQRHQAIIERFGRYPHRNAILGRESTPEELVFLSEPGSGF